MNINNLLAAPYFNLWLEGEPLDIGKILYSPSGKPRVSIFYIAHLNRLFGYFPPVANPPSKAPLLTLLKTLRRTWCWRSFIYSKSSRS